MIVPGFNDLAEPHFFQAGQSSTSLAWPLRRFIATAPPRHDVRLARIVGSLGRCQCHLEVVVVQRRLDDLVTTASQGRRLHAPYTRVPAVEVEEFHGMAATTEGYATTYSR